MVTPKSVSLIVPVFNGGKNWTRVLDAVAALQPPPGEIIVVDDGSTDESAAVALRHAFTVLHTATPRSGPAIARNLGAAHAGGEILFFIDADVLVSTDAITRVTNALQDPNVSAIFGSYDDAPDDPSFVSQYKNLTHHYVHQTSDGIATSFWAGCGAIRRETFNQAGGFSVSFVRPSIEDIELGYRVSQAGGSIRLIKDLTVKHLKRWTLRSMLVTDIRDRALPWAALIVRQGTLPSDLNLNLASRASAVLCWLLLFLLVATFLSALAWLAVITIVIALLALNFDLYRFFMLKRGLFFTLGAIPLHWLYYLYSSSALGYAILANALTPRHSAPTSPASKKQIPLPK